MHGVQQSPSCLQLDQESFEKLYQTLNKTKTRAVFSARPKKLFQKFTKGNRLRHNKSTSRSSITAGPMLRMSNDKCAFGNITNGHSTVSIGLPCCSNIHRIYMWISHTCPRQFCIKEFTLLMNTPSSAKLINMQRTISAFGIITNGALIITIRCSFIDRK